jgi:hypothetical protein
MLGRGKRVECAVRELHKTPFLFVKDNAGCSIVNNITLPELLRFNPGASMKMQLAKKEV